MTTPKTTGDTPENALEPINDVLLRGRVSADPESRQLPSGAVLVQLRVVVDRPAGSVESGRARVDTIDIACWSASTRRVALQLRSQDTVEIRGSLRRRFFRISGAAASRYEVEASEVRRVTRLGPGERARDKEMGATR